MLNKQEKTAQFGGNRSEFFSYPIRHKVHTDTILIAKVYDKKSSHEGCWKLICDNKVINETRLAQILDKHDIKFTKKHVYYGSKCYFYVEQGEALEKLEGFAVLFSELDGVLKRHREQVKKV